MGRTKAMLIRPHPMAGQRHIGTATSSLPLKNGRQSPHPTNFWPAFCMGSAFVVSFQRSGAQFLSYSADAVWIHCGRGRHTFKHGLLLLPRAIACLVMPRYHDVQLAAESDLPLYLARHRHAIGLCISCNLSSLIFLLHISSTASPIPDLLACKTSLGEN